MSEQDALEQAIEEEVKRESIEDPEAVRDHSFVKGPHSFFFQYPSHDLN